MEKEEKEEKDMPKMSRDEQKQILDRAGFFKTKGYKLVSQDDYSIYFINDKIEFIIYYGRYDEDRDISIRFLDKNGIYSVGWLAFFSEGKKNDEELSKLQEILRSLEFIENNYDKAICYEEYEKTEKLIEEYVGNVGLKG